MYNPKKDHKWVVSGVLEGVQFVHNKTQYKSR